MSVHENDFLHFNLNNTKNEHEGFCLIHDNFDLSRLRTRATQAQTD